MSTCDAAANDPTRTAPAALPTFANDLLRGIAQGPPGAAIARRRVAPAHQAATQTLDLGAEDIDMLKLIARSVHRGEADIEDAKWLSEFAERLAPHAEP